MALLLFNNCNQKSKSGEESQGTSAQVIVSDIKNIPKNPDTTEMVVWQFVQGDTINLCIQLPDTTDSIKGLAIVLYKRIDKNTVRPINTFRYDLWDQMLVSLTPKDDGEYYFGYFEQKRKGSWKQVKVELDTDLEWECDTCCLPKNFKATRPGVKSTGGSSGTATVVIYER